jgi:hypothetical protein
MENGVHVTGATTVKNGETEKDRVIQITYLTPQQIQQLLQFFQNKGIALLLQQKLVPIEMHGIIDLNDEPIPFNASGDAQIQLLPPDPQSNTVPIEIVALNLQSVEPITVELDNPQQWHVMISLQPVDHTGKLNLVTGGIPNLAFHNVGPNQDTLVADPNFPHEFEVFGCGPWPFHEAVRLHSLGRKHLLIQPGANPPLPPDFGTGPGAGGGTQEPAPGFLRIDLLELGLPLRVPVIPNGFDN